MSSAFRRLEGPLRELVGQRAGTTEPKTRARLKLSPERRAALKLQGRYMGHTRLLKPRQKAQVKALRATKGMHAAIALAAKLSKGSLPG
jgi:hypothetical protein